MNMIKANLNIIFLAIIGNLLKMKVWFYILLNIKPKQSKRKMDNIIISFTSYGHRVSKSAPYTAFSMIFQSVSPEKIVLWLDETNWNKNNLPFLLKRLLKWNLIEVKFCEDIKSYKKLIPTLKCYPEKIIITIDDDIYYSSQMIEELYNRYTDNPNKICALKFRLPVFDTNGNLSTYSKWIDYHDISRNIIDETLLFPIGFGGILYPPSSLDQAVFNQSVFMDLCPLADDIWFYIMAIKNGTLRTWVPKSKVKYYYVDLFYQVVKNDRLYDENVGSDKNDSQLKSVLMHYNLILSNKLT